jgi:hypothetical protein
MSMPEASLEVEAEAEVEVETPRLPEAERTVSSFTSGEGDNLTSISSHSSTKGGTTYPREKELPTGPGRF